MSGLWRAFVLAGAVLVLAPSAASATTYIVGLAAPPLASYSGGTGQLQATSPAVTGAAHLDVTSSAARRYRDYLDGRQRAALARVPGSTPDVIYDYRVAFAGFAAVLTPAQASALRRAPEVAHVWVDAKRQTQAVDPDDPNQVDAALGGATGDSAGYLGLPHGLWNTLGGANHAGENIIVGVIDTGITPQHPSFADHAAGNYVGANFGAPPARWHGTCDTGQDPKNFQCNNKLIGARYFVGGFGAAHVAPGSFLSPRDDDGHGTHTASTAAGNFGVDPSIGANDLGVDLISGIAPRALVAAYKICWVGGDVADGCTNSDSVGAIDAAVSDGVDVINYSVGGTTSNVVDAVELAYLGASNAGVFVANSAGNSGPGAGTVGTPTTVPWLTSVAAENPARTFTATAHITPPAPAAAFDITGASVTGALGAATPVVDAAASGLLIADPDEAELCFPGTLDPLKVAGKVVLCRRGVNDRIEKSKVVRDAGGVGMILYNPNAAQDTDTDIHYVPTVHVSLADGMHVKQAIAAGATTATIGAGHATLGAPKVLAAFSSRGPQGAVPDLAKPDVTAPGVNILAGNTPDPAPNSGLPAGYLFQSISGTSMASPHVAGAGALLTQAHPGWSPAEIKSALMETANASVSKEDGATAATPFEAGSGEIDPTKAANPGLVLDASTNDYIRYVDSQDPTIFHDGQPPIQPSDLNLASISNAQVPGTFATVRRFTSVDAAPRTWTVAVGVPGFSTSVSAAAFTLAPGATQSLTITAMRTTAPLGDYAYGALTLTSGPTTLRLPVSLRPIAAKAPPVVKLSTALGAGSQALAVTAGYVGQLNGVGFGLAAPDTKAHELVSSDADGAPDPALASASNRIYDVTVPAGAQVLSGRIANADGDAAPNTDLDLYLYYDFDGDGAFTDDEQLDQSASAVADEGVTEVHPDPGKYRFVVVGFTTKDPTSYDWSTWIVNDAVGDDTSGGPGIAVRGDPLATTIGAIVAPSLQWANVDKPALYLGLVTYNDGAGPVAESVVELAKTTDTTPPTPTPTAQPGSSPTPTPAPGPAPPAKPKLTIKVLKVSLDRTHRVLSVKLPLSLGATVSATVKRGSKVAARAGARTLAAGTRTVRMRLSRKLKRGTYTVTFTARRPTYAPVTARVTLRVRR